MGGVVADVDVLISLETEANVKPAVMNGGNTVLLDPHLTVPLNDVLIKQPIVLVDSGDIMMALYVIPQMEANLTPNVLTF